MRVAVRCAALTILGLLLTALSVNTAQAGLQKLIQFDCQPVSGSLYNSRGYSQVFYYVYLKASTAPFLPNSTYVQDATLGGGMVAADQTAGGNGPYPLVYATASSAGGYASTATLSSDVTIAFNPILRGASVTLTNYAADMDFTLTTDQGVAETKTIKSGASGVLSFSGTALNVRNLTITPSNQNKWSYGVVSVTYDSPGPFLVDPRLTFDNLTGNAKTAADLLSSRGACTGRTVLRRGVAADGTAALPVLFETAQPNMSVVFHSTNSSIGKIGTLPASGNNQIVVTSQAAQSGNYAVALVVPPADFASSPRVDLTQGTTNLLVLAYQDNGQGQEGPLLGSSSFILKRPPVALIHGLWSDPTAWEPWLANIPNFPEVFRFYLASWAFPVAPPKAVTPSDLSASYVTRTNALGLAYNAPYIVAEFGIFLNDYESRNNIGADQLDVVGHSMGGLLARQTVITNGFVGRSSHGLIHKLITMGTPHLGSPVAAPLTDTDPANPETNPGSNPAIPKNTLTRDRLAYRESPAVFSFTTDGTTYQWGAVHDLIGAGDGTGLNATIIALNPQNPALPIAMASIATEATLGAGGGTNFGGLDKACDYAHGNKCNGRELSCRGSYYTVCDTLGKMLTTAIWPTLVGQHSDGIVPLASQRNQPAANGMPAAADSVGDVHDRGTVSLGFNPPHDFTDSKTATRAQALLNTPVTNRAVFIPTGP